jgi:hypothetical protein
MVAVVMQLQQLHQQASRQQLPQHAAAATLAASPASSAQPSELLQPTDFCSAEGYRAWLYQSWHCLQEQLQQLQQLPAYSAQVQLQVQGASLGSSSHKSGSRCFRLVLHCDLNSRLAPAVSCATGTAHSPVRAQQSATTH